MIYKMSKRERRFLIQHYLLKINGLGKRINEEVERNGAALLPPWYVKTRNFLFKIFFCDYEKQVKK